MHRVLIVDDEEPARLRMRRALETVSDVQVVGEASCGKSAAEALSRLTPDIVLLDIEMPEGDGFFVLEEGIARGVVPEVIFVTAFDHYAIEAFEHGATDYLLKPAEFRRVEQAIERAKERLLQRSAEDRARHLREMMIRAKNKSEIKDPESEYLWVKSRGQIVRVVIPQIITVEADRDYVSLQTKHRVHHVRGTISDFEDKLRGRGFLRVHRSVIVRREAVTALRGKGPNAFEIDLSDGRTLAVGRSYNAQARQAFSPD